MPQVQKQKMSLLDDVRKKAENLKLIENGKLTQEGKGVLVTFSYMLRNDPTHISEKMKEYIDQKYCQKMIKFWQYCYEKANKNVKKTVELFFNALIIKEGDGWRTFRQFAAKMQKYVCLFSPTTTKDVDMGKAVAEFVAKDAALTRLLKILGEKKGQGVETKFWNAFSESAVFVKGNVYHFSNPSELENLQKRIEEIKNDEITRAVYSLAIARKWGDMRKIAKYLEDKDQKIQISEEDDEVEIFSKCLNKIQKDKNYQKRYEEVKNWSGWDALDLELDVFAKYALLTKTYDAYEKGYRNGKTTFREFIRKLGDLMKKGEGENETLLASEIATGLFADTVPYVVENHIFKSPVMDTIRMIAHVNLQTAAIIQNGRSFTYGNEKEFPIVQRFYWNPYKAASELPECAKNAVNDMRKHFLRRWLYDIIKAYHNTDPTRQPDAGIGWLEEVPSEQDLTQQTAVEQFRQYLMQFFYRYGSSLNPSVKNLLNVAIVRNPKETVNQLLNRLMDPNVLQLLQKGGADVLVSVPLSFANFQSELGKYLPNGDVLPSGWTNGWFGVDGSYSIRIYKKTEKDKPPVELKNRYGFVNATVKTWGLGNWQEMGLNISSYGDETDVYAYSTGFVYDPNFNRMRRFINWINTNAGKNMGTYQQVTNSNTDLALGLEYDEDEGMYKVILWHHEMEGKQNRFIKIAAYYLSEEEAYRLFGGYVGNNSDVRMLFEGHHIKGMMLAFNVGKEGLAYLQNNKQKTGVLVHTLSTHEALGALVYLDDTAKEALGKYWGEDMYAQLIAGTENEEHIYGISLVRKTKTVRMGAYFLHTANAARANELGVGVASSNAYAVINGFKGREGNWKGDIVCGISWNEDGAEYSMHLEHWSEVQRFALSEWLYGVYSPEMQIGNLSWAGNLFFGAGVVDLALYTHEHVVRSTFKVIEESGGENLSVDELAKVSAVTDRTVDVLTEGIKDAISYTMKDESGKAGIEVVYGGAGHWIFNVYDIEGSKGEGLRIGFDPSQVFAEGTMIDANVLHSVGFTYYKPSDQYFHKKFLAYYTHGRRWAKEKGSEEASVWYGGAGSAGAELAYLKASREFIDAVKKDYDVWIGIGKYENIEGGYLASVTGGYGKEHEEIRKDIVSRGKYWLFAGWLGGQKETPEHVKEAVNHIFAEAGLGKRKFTPISDYGIYLWIQIVKSIGEEAKGRRVHILDLNAGAGGKYSFDVL